MEPLALTLITWQRQCLPGVFSAEFLLSTTPTPHPSGPESAEGSHSEHLALNMEHPHHFVEFPLHQRLVSLSFVNYSLTYLSEGLMNIPCGLCLITQDSFIHVVPASAIGALSVGSLWHIPIIGTFKKNFFFSKKGLYDCSSTTRCSRFILPTSWNQSFL